MGSRRALATLALLLFAALTALTLFHHEMWRDELQAWSLAVASTSIPDVFERAAYEPDPNLWFVTLFATTRFTRSPAALQILNWAIACAAAATVLFLAPFPFAQRALIVSGYFLLYEYSAISRPYALAVLLIFSAAHALSIRSTPLGSAILIFLVMQTSMFAFLVALPLAALLLYDTVRSSGRRHAAGPAMLLALGILLVALELRMPPDFHFPRPGRDPVRTLSAMSDAFVPLVMPRLHYWNASALPEIWKAILGVAVLAVILFALRGSPRALFVFGSATALLLAGFYDVAGTSWRHHGFLLIALIAAMWIAHIRVPLLVTAILAVQVLAAAIAIRNEIVYEFSAAQRTATFVKTLNAGLVIGHPDNVVSPVAGYLNRPMFYPAGARFGTYVIWDRRRSDADVRAFASLLDEASQRQVRVVAVAGAATELQASPFRLVAHFGPAVVEDEAYSVYVAP